MSPAAIDDLRLTGSIFRQLCLRITGCSSHPGCPKEAFV